MNIVGEIKSLITGKPIFDNAIFLKRESDAKKDLEYLESLVDNQNVKDQELLLQQIKKVKYGIYGENKIEYELENSHIPMFVLHDIRLEYEGLTAQIDYLIITKKNTYIIECKNLYGNIEINEKGDFIRWINRHPEGIYNPITQNQRHKELIKKLRKSNKKNFITRIGFESTFDTWHKTLVVLANDKTYLNYRRAPKEIKDQIIRADQLIAYIKKTEKNSKSMNLSESDMKGIAEFFLENHHPKEYDYSHLLNEKIIEVNYEDLYKELKEYRLNKSRLDKVKPYIIFNNKQLDDLVEKLPASIDELMEIPGFAKKKCEKYGQEIINIIKQYKIG